MKSLPRNALWAALALLLAGCNCAGPTPPANDAGVEDAGVDAGEPLPTEDAGEPDAGAPDAGPPELKLLKVLPSRGGAAGGTQVLLTGSGFIRDFAGRGTEAKPQTKLKFGSNPVQDFQIIDDQTIELRAPPGKLGLVNVSIENPNGLFVCEACYTYYEELFLSSVSPKEGPLSGSNLVTLTGAGFTEDVHVLFADRASPQVNLVNSKELQAAVPRGAVADLVDVTVYNKNGVGSQRRVYRYLPDTRVTGISPLAGPLAGGTSVALTGEGLSGATAVRFGALAAAFIVDSPTQVTAVSPAGAALGSVDVTVETPQGNWTVKRGFSYVDAAGAFALYGVFPHVVSASGGDTVTLVGQGLDAAGLTVSVGGQPAAVLSQSFSTAQVQVPARGASARKVDLGASDGSQSATLPLALTYRLELGALNPSTGPASGGTALSLTGAALPADARVWLGALEASNVAVGSESALSATSPSGSGGAASDLWVREGSDPENEAVLPAAFIYEETLSIGRVQPGRGAIAGGTLVTVLGAGFGDGTVVDFGLNRAKDVKVIDSHTLTCRTPKGEVGAVDVKVRRLASEDLLSGGFSYFDPRSISGGLSGGPLAGTLNVTVLDESPGAYGQPVPLARVILGSDPDTPFQGLTDARGQLTLSDPSLVKAQTVTAWKEGYAAATVTAVNAENLTVFIARVGGDGDPALPPPGPPASLISGRVTGFKPPRALNSNESLEARVFVSQTTVWSGPPFQGPPSMQYQKWVITTDGGEYLLFSAAGLRATYAVLGVKNKQTGEFFPYLMGIHRGITTSPDNPAVNADIVLDMHLDLQVPVTIDGPLTIGPPGLSQPAQNSLYAWLDLGAEGYVPNPYNWGTGTATSSTISGTQTSFSFPAFPRLDGSNFLFLNVAEGAQVYPASYFYRRQQGDLSAGVTVGPLLPTPEFINPGSGPFTGTISWQSEPGPAPDMIQVQILEPTMGGTVVHWTMVLPGTETQVVLPPAALQQLHDTKGDVELFAALIAIRSPKFAYSQWTYDLLTGASWSAYTISVSGGFFP